MRTIKTKQDIDLLRRAKAVPATLLDHIEDCILQLKDQQDDEDRSEFRLDGCGYVVVLEAGDNVRDLGNVGLNRKGGGLLGSFPEYVELLDVGGGLQAHKVTVLTSHRPGHTTRRWNNG